MVALLCPTCTVDERARDRLFADLSQEKLDQWAEQNQADFLQTGPELIQGLIRMRSVSSVTMTKL